MEVLDLSPAAGRSESPSQGGEGRSPSKLSTPSEASERSEFRVDDAARAEARSPVDGDADRPAEGRVLSPTAEREDEPRASAPQPRVKLVKLYVPSSTFEELNRAVAASGLSRSSFVGTSFVVGMRALSKVLNPELE